MKLNQLSDNNGARPGRKRVGRGIGSGMGKTSTRGHKGQKARSGVALKAFEGGQQPIYRRLPKRGFFNLFRVVFHTVNLGELQAAVDAKKFPAGKTVTREALVNAGLIRDVNKPVKLLAKGTISASVTLEVDAASAKAQAAIIAAGGKVVVGSPAASE